MFGMSKVGQIFGTQADDVMAFGLQQSRQSLRAGAGCARQEVVLLHYRLEILLEEILRCLLHLNLTTDASRKARCLVARPCTRFLQRSKLLRFSSRRMSWMTFFSVNPNCDLMASNGVRSSQAIWIMRSVTSGVSSVCSIFRQKQNAGERVQRLKIVSRNGIPHTLGISFRDTKK